MNKVDPEGPQEQEATENPCLPSQDRRMEAWLTRHKAGWQEKDLFSSNCVTKDTASSPPNLNERAWFPVFLCVHFII